MFTRLRNNFITGVAILLPVALTIIIIRFLAVKINSFILNPLVGFLNLNPYLSAHSLYIAKVLVFVIVVLLVSFVGWAANIIFLRKLFSFGERIFIKVPMIGKVYSVIKEIGSAFLGKDKAFFKKVVLIEYPRKGIYSIGFVTGEGSREMKNSTSKDLVSVFIATTPNPTSGVFLMVPRDEMKFLDMTVEQGLKLVVSSGTVTSDGVGPTGPRA